MVLEISVAITSECILDQVENSHSRELIELGSTYKRLYINFINWRRIYFKMNKSMSQAQSYLKASWFKNEIYISRITLKDEHMRALFKLPDG